MNFNSPKEITRLLARYGANVRKSWGQNFLLNPDLVEKIVRAAEIAPTDTVLEVGPGLGVMTQQLLKRAAKVVAVEIDPLLCRILRDCLDHHDNFLLVEGDILTQDIANLAAGNYTVVANLPYYISSPFLLKLLEQKVPPRRAVLLLQQEVAQRIAAPPANKEYGSLSVLVQFYCHAEVVHKVAPGNFFPPPKVNSAVLRLTWHKEVPYKPQNPHCMFRIVRVAFAQRRKMLKGLLAREFNLPSDQVGEMLQQANLDAKVRGENLAVRDFVKLADVMEEFL